jgi:hypothetical protein
MKHRGNPLVRCVLAQEQSPDDIPLKAALGQLQLVSHCAFYTLSLRLL